jgi:hypothetical protein
MSKYYDIIKVRQAAPVSNFSVSNFFPLVGENITLTNLSTDDDSFVWQLNNGLEVTQNNIDDVIELSMNTPDDKSQSLSVTNTIKTITATKHIYPLPQPDVAYYEFTIDKTVSRQNESVILNLINKYNFINDHSVIISIIDHENNTTISSVVYTGLTYTSGLTHTFSLPNVGIYDIEVESVTDGYSVYYKKGMILTVTKELSSIENAVIFNLLPTSEYSIGYAVIDGINYNYSGITISSGTTIVINRDENYPEDSIYRIRIQNLHGTTENPIILTIDRSTPLDFGFESFWGIFMGNCDHVIVDGRGYQNIQYGFNLHQNSQSDTGVICLQGGNKSTDIEIHNIECHDSSFAGIMFKTDPSSNDPTTWRPTVDNPSGFTCYNLKIHNNYFHHSGGEGNYLGYFNAGVLSHDDSSGVTHEYRAHQLINTKVYKNRYYRCGWDSIQLNNGYDCEVAFNTVTDSAWLGETNQNTGMSLSLNGSVHDNIINGCNGLAMQILPLSGTTIYNNEFYNLPNGVSVIMLMGGEGIVPEVNPNNTLSNNIPIEIYNNNLITVGNGFIITAQNVVQYNGLLLRNNIIRYLSNYLFGGQNQGTIDLWTTNATNNVNLIESDYPIYKIGSVSDSNFDIYPDSILATGGLLIGEMYDIRGYKNWISDSKFIGSHSSIIKLPLTILEVLTLTLNNNVSQTKVREISVSYTSKGYPTHYMISEDINFSDSTWIDISNQITFTLTGFDGTKNIYFKLKNTLIESNVVSSSIYYSESLRYLVSLNPSSGYNSPLPWNNFVGDPAPIGTTLTGLKDQYNVTSNLSLTILSSFDGGSSSASSSEIYPYLAKSVARNWIVYKSGSAHGIGTFLLSGCTDNKVYDISLYSNRLFLGGNMVYSVNNVDVSYNNLSQNVNSICVFSNVVPSGDTITISVKPDVLLTHDGELALLDIKEHNSNPILYSILINSGDTETYKTTNTIQVSQAVFPTEYLISENSSFINAIWQTYVSDHILYTFNNSNIGTKTIYLQLKNDSGLSTPASDTIDYLGARLSLDSIIINYGAVLTPNADVLISINYSDGVPTKYKISETNDISGVSWTTWTSNLINYTFTSVGTKIVYIWLTDDIYETPSVSDSIDYFILVLDSILLNSGSSATQYADINVTINYSGGSPTHYKLSESNLSSIDWVVWSGNTIPFTLSTGYTSKTVYCQLKDEFRTSSEVNSTINYVNELMDLTSVSINNGDINAFSTNVNVDITYDGEPNEYIISENSGFTDTNWLTYITGSTIPFILSSGYTTKSIYVKLRTLTLFESDIMSDNITLTQLKTIVSLAGINTGVTYQTLDGESINVLKYAKNESLDDFILKDNSGSMSGLFVVKPSEFPSVTGFTIQTLTNVGHDPSLTGDTGTYPDSYINKFYYTTNVNISGNRGLIRFSDIDEGVYTVRILESSNSAYNINSRYQMYIRCNDNTIVTPNFVSVNNTTGFTEIKGVNVSNDGFLDIYFYNTGSLSILPGVNLIEFYKENLDQTTKTYIIDLGSTSTGKNSVLPYNNFAIGDSTFVPLNTTLSNIVSMDNQISNISLIVNSDNWYIRGGDNSSSNSTYLGTAMVDAFTISYPSGGTLQLSGCSDAKTYTVKILQAKTTGGYIVNTTVNGVLQSQNITVNVTPLIWNNVTSSGGIINISTISTTVGSYAPINVIELIET